MWPLVSEVIRICITLTGDIYGDAKSIFTFVTRKRASDALFNREYQHQLTGTAIKWFLPFIQFLYHFSCTQSQMTVAWIYCLCLVVGKVYPFFFCTSTHSPKTYMWGELGSVRVNSCLSSNVALRTADLSRVHSAFAQCKLGLAPANPHTPEWRRKKV